MNVARNWSHFEKRLIGQSFLQQMSDHHIARGVHCSAYKTQYQLSKCQALNQTFTIQQKYSYSQFNIQEFDWSGICLYKSHKPGCCQAIYPGVTNHFPVEGHALCSTNTMSFFKYKRNFCCLLTFGLKKKYFLAILETYFLNSYT